MLVVAVSGAAAECEIGASDRTLHPVGEADSHLERRGENHSMLQQIETMAQNRQAEWVAVYRRRHPAADRWATGFGMIEHTSQTQARVFALAETLAINEQTGDGLPFFDLLAAADVLTNAAMWLVVHQTYAHNVYGDGRDLAADDFKVDPEGHTGGALNMVPAYIGYLTANVVSGFTRAWVMGQGHCVAAIDSTNLLVGNLSPVHAARYDLTDAGLSRYVNDYYAYAVGADGRPASPLGSHVNVYTAGGTVEGGYLGFTELQYEHMPLPGERLVAFLSDGAFEEQRGSDWAGRWWRPEDCGLVTPIMINNGRRIDQRTTMNQEGGTAWFEQHLRLNGFDPLTFDGTDPAAYLWAIIEMEARLASNAVVDRDVEGSINIPLPYGIAVAPKGAGFYGAGTNQAHNLPLGDNPHTSPLAARHFNDSARRLWVPTAELQTAISQFQQHAHSGRVPERNHPLTSRNVHLKEQPAPNYRPLSSSLVEQETWTHASPMAAVDEMFLRTVQANPQLRPRVGNPDEMRSNRMQRTLDALKFRVTAPELGLPESLHGAVITALNEEAVVSAALGNKGGINMVVSYEAFAAKMQGALRQEVIFAGHQRAAGQQPGWLSVPIVLTSHTWENGKNEQSHQDPALAEAMLGEASDGSRVLFPADYNTAAATTQAVYQSQGQIWTLVVPKGSVADLFSAEAAAQLLADGAARLDWAGYQPDQAKLVLTAVGAYQLAGVLKASRRLVAATVPHSVVYMIEPGRFRQPRSQGEQAQAASDAVRSSLYPDAAQARLFVVHTRPEPLLGTLWPLVAGQTAALGYINRGGTLDTEGMLYTNRCSWAHILAEAARLLGLAEATLLNVDECAALAGERSPEGIILHQ